MMSSARIVPKIDVLHYFQTTPVYSQQDSVYHKKFFFVSIF